VALVFLTPLLFCPWSYDGFELLKLLLARVLIALALAGAALVAPRGRLLPTSPLHAPVLALLGVTALATACSVAPGLSLVGTYQHYSGLLTVAGGVILYFLAPWVSGRP
jgi:hypothetical protein